MTVSRCSKDIEMEELKVEISKREQRCNNELQKVQKLKKDTEEEGKKALAIMGEAEQKLKEAKDIKSEIRLELQMAEAKGQKFTAQLAQLAEDKSIFMKKVKKFEILRREYEERINGIDGEAVTTKMILDSARNTEVALRAKEVSLKERSRKLDAREIDLDELDKELSKRKEINKVDAEANRRRKKELSCG